MGIDIKKELAARKQRQSKEPKRMRIEQAANGGFIASHDNPGPEYQPSTKHALKDGKALLAHVKEHMC